MKKEIDIKSIRDATLAMNSNTDFESKYCFYYDETNNIKKFNVHEDGYNNSYDSNFILGGVVYEGEEPNIDDLFKGLKLQKTLKDVKFKHIAKGSFVECLKSEKLIFFLNYLLESNIYIHYSTVNLFYYSIVDIVDSAIANSSIAIKLGPDFSFELKSALYKLMNIEKEAVQELFYRYQYPNIKSENVLEFINELSLLFEPYIKEFEFHVVLTSLKQILKEADKEGELPFIMNNDDYILLQDFYHFYLRPIYTFKNSIHFFDKEDEVEEVLEQIQIKCGDEIIDSYEFVDSESNRYIQSSDIVVGILGRLFEFLNTSSLEEIRNIRASLNDSQVKNLDNLLDLIDKSEEKNKAFLHSSMSIIDHEKLAALYENKRKKKGKRENYSRFSRRSEIQSKKPKKKKSKTRTNRQIVERWQKMKRSRR